MRRTDLQGMAPGHDAEKLRRDRLMTPEERLRKMDELIVDLMRLQKLAQAERKPRA